MEDKAKVAPNVNLEELSPEQRNIFDQFTKGSSEDLTVTIQKWETPGQTLIGTMLAYEDFKGPLYDKPCKRYTFDTGEGRVSAIFGTVTDKTLAMEQNIGAKFVIVFNGRVQSKTTNREYNDFTPHRIR